MQVIIRRSVTVGSSLVLVATVFIAALGIACSKGGLSTLTGATTLPEVPQSQWLYVLDTKRKTEEGQILTLNADTGEVVKAIPTGLAPAFVLSPKGDRAYVVSRPKGSLHYTLAVVDLPTGVTLDLQTLVDRPDYTTHVPPSTIAVSPDGRWVYILKLHWTAADQRAGISQKDEYSVAVYDTNRRIFANTVSLSGSCYGRHLLSSAGVLSVFCPETNDASVFSSTTTGLDSRPRTVTLPRSPELVPDPIAPTTTETTSVHPALVGGVASADGVLLTIVMSYMRMIQIDMAVGKVAVQKQVRDDRWAMPETVVSSPDGSRLYVAVGPISRRNRFPGVNEILVIDTRTLAELETIRTSDLFQSLSISRDGRWLYAVSPDTRSIQVIDTIENRQSRTWSGIGVSPVKLAAGSPE
jgi:DNA-binding beta-propeller fold protein YncE